MSFSPFKSSNYQSLSDNNHIGSNHHHKSPYSFYSNEIFTKFCTYGLVTSKKWSDTYIVIQDGFIRLYDSENTYKSNPANYVLEIFLDNKYKTSPIQYKNYSKDAFKPIMIFYTYIIIENGMFSPSKILKIGSFNRNIIEDIEKAVQYATRL